MRILALDSSGMTASAAIVEEEKIIAEYNINNKLTHSQTLLPMIDEICRMANQELEELDAIALAGGPGSFTGLRIGSATAKGMGLALKKPLVNVPTLEAMAYSGWGRGGITCALMDARNEQAFWGIYRYDTESDMMRPVSDQSAGPLQEMLERLNELGEEVFLVGDGAAVYREKITEVLHVPCLFAPAYLGTQRAAMVGFAAIRYMAQGRTETAAQHRPEYLRVSQAERMRAQSL